MKGCQEERFAMDINTLKEKEAVVVMDFKANISLGRGPKKIPMFSFLLHNYCLWSCRLLQAS